MAPLPLRQASSGSTCTHERRPSKRGLWRGIVLLTLTLIFIAHFIQSLVGETTLSPLEPSEAMQTLELGYVNAGFLLFCAAILGTLVWGRFFCGWGCHLVGMQDLCTVWLRKIGMRPKPFRSRLLVYVPLFTALYMFVWPQVLRVAKGEPFPTLRAHLMTDNFWATFPGPTMSIITLILAGFAIVWLLGNKGFCTYGCPYGGFFYYVDKLAPGKIRVTDACDGCGICTSVCTSNVRIHEEVAHYKMVVDSGCMKNMDCVSVCPNKALYFGFGSPLPSKELRQQPKPRRRFDFTLAEELFMAAAFVLTFYAFRGLYGAVSLLLTIGISSIAAYMLITGSRLLTRKNVRFQRIQLKRSGKFNISGVAFGAIVLLFLVWVGHSVVLQFRVHEADRLLTAAQERFEKNPRDRQAEAFARESLSHFRWADSFSPVQVADWKAKIGSLYAYLGHFREAESYLDAALVLNPDSIGALTSRVELAQSQKDPVAEKRALTLLASKSSNTAPTLRLAEILFAEGKALEALKLLEKSLKQHPSDASVLKEISRCQLALGNREAARTKLREALQYAPNDAEARYALALALGKEQQQEAIEHLRKAILLDSQYVAPKLLLGSIMLESGDLDTALTLLEQGRSIESLNPRIVKIWAQAHKRNGSLRQKLNELIRSDAEDFASWYAASALYDELGERSQARAIFERLKRRNPSLEQP